MTFRVHSAQGIMLPWEILGTRQYVLSDLWRRKCLRSYSHTRARFHVKARMYKRKRSRRREALEARWTLEKTWGMDPDCLDYKGVTQMGKVVRARNMTREAANGGEL